MSLAADLTVMLNEAAGALSTLDADRLEALLRNPPTVTAELCSEEELAALATARSLYGLLVEATAMQLRTLHQVCPTGETPWQRLQA